MTLRSAVWTGVALAAIGIGGLVFTGVVGATGLHLPWAHTRDAPTYGGMMGTGGGAGGYAGMMGGGSDGAEGMMGHSAAGIMGGTGAGAMGTAMAGTNVQSVSTATAQSLGDAVPAGATADRARNRLVFQTPDVHLAVLASPADGPDMTFRIAGMADPTVVVPQGAQVSVEFLNADADTAHGWLLTPGAPSSFPYMAMMADPPAFGRSFAVPLGNPTATAMPVETITFTASQSGQYTYLCPVPGHAQRGMHGGFEVTA